MEWLTFPDSYIFVLFLKLPNLRKRINSSLWCVSCDMYNCFPNTSQGVPSGPEDYYNAGSLYIWSRVELASKKQNIPYKALEKIPSSTGSFFVFLFWNRADASGSGKKWTMYTEMFRNPVFMIFLQLRFCHGFFFFFLNVSHLTLSHLTQPLFHYRWHVRLPGTKLSSHIWLSFSLLEIPL